MPYCRVRCGVRVLRMCLSALVLTWLSACDEAPPTEVWTASDHAQPETQAQTQGRARPAGASAPADPRVARLNAARAVYRMQCQSCHGAEGRGDEAMAGNVPNFADPSWQESRSHEELARSITQGRGAMPAFSNLPPDAVVALVEVVRGFASE